MTTTITRIWHGLIRTADKERYTQYIIDTGIAGYRAIPGNLGASMLFRKEGEHCHIYTVSEWDSIDSIKAFAGEDHAMARYYPEDDAFLLEKERFVQHLETLRF